MLRAESSLRHHLVVLGDQVGDHDLDRALAQVKDRAGAQRNRNVRRWSAGVLAVALVAAGVGYRSIELPAPVRPADPNERIEERRSVEPDHRVIPIQKEVTDARSRNGERNRKSVHEKQADKTRRDSPTPTEATSIPRTDTPQTQAPSRSARATWLRVEKRAYGAPLAEVGGLSSSCVYSDENASCSVFDVAERDAWLVVNVADAAGDVRFSVTQWIGPENAPGTDSAEEQQFCGGDSDPIELLPRATRVLVAVSPDPCPGGDAPQGGEITASFSALEPEGSWRTQ